MISIDEFANTTPVNNPIVSKNINPKDHKLVALYDSCDPCKVVNHLKVLISVGTAIIMIADVK
jgi:hypothetical protein